MKQLLSTPLGLLTLRATKHGLSHLSFEDADAGAEEIPTPDHPHLAHAARELRAYFAGELTTFTVPLDPPGTNFQRAVWTVLSAIPHGRTVTYGAIARQIGNPRGSQAVGLANGANPIPIIVPCHRVVGANGKLTGYSGGIKRKKWLLRHESTALF